MRIVNVILVLAFVIVVILLDFVNKVVDHASDMQGRIANQALRPRGHDFTEFVSMPLSVATREVTGTVRERWQHDRVVRRKDAGARGVERRDTFAFSFGRPVARGSIKALPNFGLEDLIPDFLKTPRRGMHMIGWQGKSLEIPFGISNSRASQVFQNSEWPPTWPYKASDFRRMDETNDAAFYDQPRLVAHIDRDAIKAIRNFYELQFALAPQGEYSVLDICSSWISHYPEDLSARRVAVTGMVKDELALNKQATEYVAKDLNVDPVFPYGDNEFDFVTNVVSVDYLSNPREIFNEIHRVLKPGGVAIMSFSNRCFYTKAIAMWVRDMSDGPGHCRIVGNYFHFNPVNGWRDISSADISLNPGRSDPMWVVTAVKAA